LFKKDWEGCYTGDAPIAAADDYCLTLGGLKPSPFRRRL
jgi:hypothetical protein